MSRDIEMHRSKRNILFYTILTLNRRIIPLLVAYKLTYLVHVSEALQYWSKAGTSLQIELETISGKYLESHVRDYIQSE